MHSTLLRAPILKPSSPRSAKSGRAGARTANTDFGSNGQQRELPRHNVFKSPWIGCRCRFVSSAQRGTGTCHVFGPSTADVAGRWFVTVGSGRTVFRAYRVAIVDSSPSCMASTTDTRLRPAVESQPHRAAVRPNPPHRPGKRCAGCGTCSTEDTRQGQVFATLMEMMEAQRRA